MQHTLFSFTGFGLGNLPLEPLLALLQQSGMHVKQLPLPKNLNLQAYLQALVSEHQISADDVLLGWSFGGQIATHVAALTGSRLITLASNPQFCADVTWPHAMAAATFAQFAAQHQQDPVANLKQFVALTALGDVHPDSRQWVKTLRQHIASLTATALQDSEMHLHCLQHGQTQAMLQTLPQRQLHVLGDADALVPVAVATCLAAWPQSEVAVVAGASHLLPLTHADACARHISNFLEHP